MKVNFSIIIPIHKPNYNYLKECLKSISPQLDQDDQLICILNGNTIEENNQIRNYLPLNTTILEQKEGNVSIARNTGISKAKNDYILFIDCDDIIGDNLLESAKKIIGDCNPDYITFMDTSDLSKLNQGDCKNHNVDRDAFLEIWQGKAYRLPYFFQFRSCWNHIYKKDIVLSNNIKFNENQKIAEDTLFNFEYTLNSESFIIVNYTTYYYRQNEKGSSVGYKEDAIDIINTIITNYLKLLVKYNLSPFYYSHLYNEILFNYLPYIFRNCLFHKDNNLSFNKRREILKKYCKNEIIQKAVNTIRTTTIKNKKHRIFLMMLKCKMYSLICLVYKKQ